MVLLVEQYFLIILRLFLSNFEKKPDKLLPLKDIFVKWDNWVILDEIWPSKWQLIRYNSVKFVNWNIQSGISLSNHFIKIYSKDHKSIEQMNFN